MTPEQVRERQLRVIRRGYQFLASSTGVGTVILAMAFGMFLLQPWGWVVAAILMWLSPRWTTRTKAAVTAIVPAAILVTLLLTSPVIGFPAGYAAFFILGAPMVSAAVLWARTIPGH